MNDAESYTRRKNASIGLKALLDGTAYNTKKVVLLGDFNDYLNGTQCSTCTPNESPYKNFTDDTQNYKCLTTGLNDPAYSSPVIDNIIISNELFDNYKLYSTNREVAATQVIPNYTTTTSDHTPVSATFNITVGAPQCQNMAVSESFGQSLGNFTPQSVSGAQLWAWKQGYGAAMSGYVTSNNPNEDWLISPAFDLSDKSSASIAFNHALNFCPTESDKVANQSLWVSTNYYTGAQETATWTQLTIPIMPSGSTWAFVNSGNIKLPAQLMQNNVRFAFKYLSTTAVAGTWEIKDFTLNAECILSDVPTVATSPQNKVFVLDKQLTIRNTRLESVAVYDITGRTLFSAPKVLNTEIPIYQPGIYIVHVGNNVSKVIVK